MRELAPGLWHWTALRESIGSQISSYYLSAERVMIDPMIPRDGLEWLSEHGPPTDLVLSNRHHDRDAWKLREAFGCTVHCVRNGLHEVQGRGPIEPFEFGDELPGGIVVHEVGAICADETALHIPAHAALACADGIVRSGGELAFVPDWLMDDPEHTKQALRAAYRRLLELDFDLLLLAHGDPLDAGGREALREFASR